MNGVNLLALFGGLAINFEALDVTVLVTFDSLDATHILNVFRRVHIVVHSAVRVECPPYSRHVSIFSFRPFSPCSESIRSISKQLNSCKAENGGRSYSR